MAHVNPPSGLNPNSVSQRGQLSNIQRQMNTVAPGWSATPPSAALNNVVVRQNFIDQTRRAYNSSMRGSRG